MKFKRHVKLGCNSGGSDLEETSYQQLLSQNDNGYDDHRPHTGCSSLNLHSSIRAPNCTVWSSCGNLEGFNYPGQYEKAISQLPQPAPSFTPFYEDRKPVQRLPQYLQPSSRELAYDRYSCLPNEYAPAYDNIGLKTSLPYEVREGVDEYRVPYSHQQTSIKDLERDSLSESDSYGPSDSFYINDPSCTHETSMKVDSGMQLDSSQLHGIHPPAITGTGSCNYINYS